MTIGPAPMIRMLSMSVRLGMRLSRAVFGIAAVPAAVRALGEASFA